MFQAVGTANGQASHLLNDSGLAKRPAKSVHSNHPFAHGQVSPVFSEGNKIAGFHGHCRPQGVLSQTQGLGCLPKMTEVGPLDEWGVIIFSLKWKVKLPWPSPY